MTWKKIDDAQALPDMPYSSFLANGLTGNANSYNEALTRGGSIALNATNAVVWSSYYTPQGFMFTVNVGQSVTAIDFRLSYGTVTNHVDADGFQGYVYLQHLGGDEFVRRGLPPSGPVLDITLPLLTACSGPQAFSLTFQSSKLDSKGTVKVVGGLHQLIYLQENNPVSYQVVTGEKHELIDISQVPSPGPSQADALSEYQINYVSVSTVAGADGNAIISPMLENDPSRLNAYIENKQYTAEVYELGALGLTGIAYNVTTAGGGNAPAQYSHNTAGPLASVINIQNTSRVHFQPDLCNSLSQSYSFGTVIAGLGVFSSAPTTPQTTSFSFVLNAAVLEKTLSVTFQYFGLKNSGIIKKMKLSLLDQAGALIATNEQDLDIDINRTALSVIGITARNWKESLAVPAWGMRDSMSVDEMLTGFNCTMNVPNLTLAANTVYTVKLELMYVLNCIYMYNVYARITPPLSAG